MLLKNKYILIGMRFIALGGGSGLSPIAPGTVATILTALAYSFILPYSNELINLTLLIGLLISGYIVVGANSSKANSKYEHDESAIVIDEIAAFWAVLYIFSPTSLSEYLIAILLFRFFDIFKPFGIKSFEKNHLTPYGVMGDDVIAAIYTLLVLAIYTVV